MPANSHPERNTDLSVLAADQALQARIRPNRVRVVVSKGVISVDNETPGAPPADKVWGLPGGTVVFVVENRDTVAHQVSIPIGEFMPSARPEFKDAPATRDPFVAGQQDSIDVAPGRQETLALRLQPYEHFQFGKREPWMSDKSRLMSMTYKYNVYALPSGGQNKIKLDPELEIDRP